MKGRLGDTVIGDIDLKILYKELVIVTEEDCFDHR